MYEIFKRVAQILAGPAALFAAGLYVRSQPATTVFTAYCALAAFACAATAVAAAGAGVAYAAIGGLVARRSRHGLITLFAIGRRVVPIAMAVTALGSGAAAIALVGWLGTQFHVSGAATVKLGLVALALMGGAFVGVKALVATLRVARLEPMDLMGRAVSPREAPELWALLRRLAAEVGAPVPDAVVVGILGGPFVTACDTRLAPDGRMLSGRILYLPLPSLLILDIAQLACVLSHELAHFSGEDVEYSLRLAPNYAAMGKGVRTALAHVDGGLAAQVVTIPAISQLVLLIGLFDLAVQRWSRERELRADRIGARAIGADFAATALARYVAFDPVIGETLGAALEKPDAPHDDLVAEVAEAVRRVGAQDPRPHLAQTTPHPTDTHPPIAARIEALGQKIDDAFLAEAGMAAPADHAELVDLFFADARSLCRQLSDDLLGAARARRAAAIAHLENMASATVARRAFFEKPSLDQKLNAGFGWAALAAGAALIVLSLSGAKIHLLAENVGWSLRFGAILAAIGAFFAYRARLSKSRRETPFLEIAPETCRLPDAGLTLAWREIDAIHIGTSDGFAALFVLGAAARPPSGPLGPRIAFDAKRRELTVTAQDVGGAGRADLAAALVSAHRAAHARDALREAAAA